MRAVAPITYLNWSPGVPGNRLLFRAKRMSRTLGCLCKLISHGRVRNARLYVVCNSKDGLLLTALLVNSGRLLGYRVYLHHHTYYYLDRYDWRMAWIDRSMGVRGVHVVHCPQMADDFRAMYATERAFVCVLPSVFSLPLGEPRELPGSPFRLGNLGNQVLEKGLDLVLATFRTLLDNGRSVELHLAGPLHSKEAKRLVQLATHEFPDRVKYAGPVYGKEKEAFFASIDCFLFPSRSESWGIVLNEAMAAGVPVVASERGCVRTAVGDGGGLVVHDDSDYVSLAVQQIETWIDAPAAYRTASQSAIDQAERLNRHGRSQLAEFAMHMCAPCSNG
jgi:glycosyltransferase involved in cell wall biosynthesis